MSTCCWQTVPCRPNGYEVKIYIYIYIYIYIKVFVVIWQGSIGRHTSTCECNYFVIFQHLGGTDAVNRLYIFSPFRPAMPEFELRATAWLAEMEGRPNPAFPRQLKVGSAPILHGAPNACACPRMPAQMGAAHRTRDDCCSGHLCNLCCHSTPCICGDPTTP